MERVVGGIWNSDRDTRGVGVRGLRSEVGRWKVFVFVFLIDFMIQLCSSQLHPLSEGSGAYLERFAVVIKTVAKTSLRFLFYCLLIMFYGTLRLFGSAAAGEALFISIIWSVAESSNAVRSLGMESLVLVFRWLRYPVSA